MDLNVRWENLHRHSFTFWFAANGDGISGEVLNPLRFSQILTLWIVSGADFGDMDGYYGSCEML